MIQNENQPMDFFVRWKEAQVSMLQSQIYAIQLEVKLHLAHQEIGKLSSPNLASHNGVNENPDGLENRHQVENSSACNT